MNTRFFFVSIGFLKYVWSRYYACSFVLCGLGDVLDRNALSGIRFVAFSAFRKLYDPDKLVVNHNPLASVFACSFRFIDRDFVDQFPQQRCCQCFHFHKPPDCPNELLLVLLHGINRIEPLKKFGNPAFQFHSLDFILVG